MVVRRSTTGKRRKGTVWRVRLRVGGEVMKMGVMERIARKGPVEGGRLESTTSRWRRMGKWVRRWVGTGVKKIANLLGGMIMEKMMGEIGRMLWRWVRKGGRVDWGMGVYWGGWRWRLGTQAEMQHGGGL